MKIGRYTSVKITTSLFLNICVILSAVIVSAGYISIIGTMYILNENQLTVAWDQVLNAKEYEVRLCLFDRQPITYFGLARTTETQFTFNRPRSGHFNLEVRARNDLPPEQCDGRDPCCSDWATSLEAQYCYENKPWWIYWQLPEVTEGGIE